MNKMERFLLWVAPVLARNNGILSPEEKARREAQEQEDREYQEKFHREMEKRRRERALVVLTAASLESLAACGHGCGPDAQELAVVMAENMLVRIERGPEEPTKDASLEPGEPMP